MKALAAVMILLFFAGCSGPQQQRQSERSVPQCLSLCGNQFAACTEEYPGDFSACRADRDECEQTCREQKALREMEDDEDEEVIAPTTSEPEPTPEEEPADNPLEEKDPDSDDEPESDETPE